MKIKIFSILISICVLSAPSQATRQVIRHDAHGATSSGGGAVNPQIALAAIEHFLTTGGLEQLNAVFPYLAQADLSNDITQADLQPVSQRLQAAAGELLGLHLAPGAMAQADFENPSFGPREGSGPPSPYLFAARRLEVLNLLRKYLGDDIGPRIEELAEAYYKHLFALNKANIEDAAGRHAEALARLGHDGPGQMPGSVSVGDSRLGSNLLNAAALRYPGDLPLAGTEIGLPPDGVARLFLSLHTQISLQTRLQRRGEGLTENELLALAILQERGTMIIGDIQRALGVLPAQMSRIIRSLEQYQPPLITCTINPRDKRKIDVNLTDVGREALSQNTDSRAGRLASGRLGELPQRMLDWAAQLANTLKALLGP